jgi:HEAT repeat protein
MIDAMNFQPYLDSICRYYAEWWNLDTLTSTSDSQQPLFDFEQIVQLIVPRQRHSKEEQPNSIELTQEQSNSPESTQDQLKPFSILQNPWNYLDKEHILLFGRPGAGKSTALVRLLVGAAERAKLDSTLQNFQTIIPVLVDLGLYPTRSRNTSGILDLIEDFFENHDCPLDTSIIRRLITEKRLLLLIDGVNELSKEALTDLKTFQRKPLPIILTTRDSEQSGLEGIKQKLEIQPLSPTEVQRFIQQQMPGQDGQKLKELSNRIRDFGETPLVVWMLYRVFQQTGDVPETLGEALREFTKRYERDHKVGKVNAAARDLLRHLAFEMMHSEEPTDFRIVVSEEEAIRVFRQFLEREQTPEPTRKAREYLDNLLNHHLIQRKGKNRIGFCHQLLQEYYAAEELLEMLQQKHPDLIEGKRFQHYYLNYLKWTESIALMMGLLDDETQVIQIVEQALEVDLTLGAKLAGQVKREFQNKTIDLITALNYPGWLEVELLGSTRSNAATPLLIRALSAKDINIAEIAAEFLGETDNQTAIQLLYRRLKDIDSTFFAQTSFGGTDNTGEIWSTHIQALAHIAPQEAVQFLRNKVLDQTGRWDTVLHFFTQAPKLLIELDHNRLIPELLESSNSSRSKRQKEQVLSLIEYTMEHELVVPKLVEILQQEENEDIKKKIISLLGASGNELAGSALVKLIDQPIVELRREAAKQLIGKKYPNITSELQNLLSHQDWNISWWVAVILGSYGDSAALPIMSYELENHEKSDVRCTAARFLGMISDDKCVPHLLKALHNDPDEHVRREAAFSLSHFGEREAIPELDNALKNGFPQERRNAIRSLTKLEIEEPLWEVIHAKSYGWQTAAVELGKLGRVNVLPYLFEALARLEHYEQSSEVMNLLSKLMDSETLSKLITALERPEQFEAESYFLNRIAFVLIECKPEIVAAQLPSLINLRRHQHIPQLSWIIPSIQNNCKFYNYNIAQASLPSVVQSSNSSQGSPNVIFNIKNAYGVAGNVERDQIIHPSIQKMTEGDLPT